MYCGPIPYSEWNDEQSGCFRPALHDSTSHKSLENNRVTSLNPVMLMVSDSAYDVLSPGYEGGLYCKWQVTGDAHLLVEFIDVNIYPVTENCDYDGLVILRNGSQEQLGKSGKIAKAHVSLYIILLVTTSYLVCKCNYYLYAS